MRGEDTGATSAGDDCNIGQGHDLAALLSRGGKRAPIDDFIFVLRCPEQFARLGEKQRHSIETSNEALRERFSREVLALIVVLQERILIAHGARRAFVAELRAQGITEVNATFLSRRLGGPQERGPHGAWWLAERIARHCAHGTSAGALRRRFARLWHAAYGELPKEAQDLADSLTPMSEREIAELVDAPGRPAGRPALPETGLLDGSAAVAAVLDGIPDAVLFLDAHGTLLHSNRAAEALLRSHDGGLVGRGVIDVLPSFDITRLPRIAENHDGHQAADQQPPLRLQARCLDGRDLLVEVSSTPLHGSRPDKHGSAGAAVQHTRSSYVGRDLLMVILKDLTGSQRLERELARQQRQTELILRAAGEGILRVDGDVRITLANAAAAAALGYQPSELDGMQLASLLRSVRPDGTPRPFHDTLLGRCLSHGHACSLRGQSLLAKDGVVVPVDIRAMPMMAGHSGSGSVITFRLRRPAERNIARGPAADPTAEIERADVSRLKTELMEYHQVLIQILARMDQPGVEAVARLTDVLAPAARKDLLASAEAARAGFAVPVPFLTVPGATATEPDALSSLDQVVHTSVRTAAARSALADTRCTVFAPPTPLNSDGTWLAGLLAQLLAGALPGGSLARPVLIAAAKRGQRIRIDIRGTFPDCDREQMAKLEGEVQAHAGTFHTLATEQADAPTVMVLEVPDTTRTPQRTHAEESTPPPAAAALAERKISTRLPVDLPGVRLMPPVVIRHPTAEGSQRPGQHSTNAQGAARARLPDARGPHHGRSTSATSATAATPADHGIRPEGTRPPHRPGTRHPSGSPLSRPALRITSGRLVLTVASGELSHLDAGPDTHLVRAEKRTKAERAEVEHAARPPGPAQPPVPLVARQEVRDQLVRMLARGRCVRLVGPAGSGRTRLLEVVAEDCADLAPDGVVRLSGHCRSAEELLYDLFSAVHNAPLHRPDTAELLTYTRQIGAVVVLDDIEFGGAALDGLLDATPECAFLIGATPDVPAPSADAGVAEVALDGLDRAASIDLLEHAVGRRLTEDESNWAGDLWFESEGLPLRFVQAGALLRQRDQVRAGDPFGVFDSTRAGAPPFPAAEGDDIALPSIGEAAALAPLLASRLSASARATLQFAVALGGEIPHQAHLPALVGDTHADAAVGELVGCGLVTPVGSRYRLAAGVLVQLQAAAYGEDAPIRASAAAAHYRWWAAHPLATPQQVCTQAPAVLATLHALAPGTGPSAKGQDNPAVHLARTVAPAFASGLHWSAWQQALRAGAQAATSGEDMTGQAYFHHELGTLNLCVGEFKQARIELEAAMQLHGALHDTHAVHTSRHNLNAWPPRPHDASSSATTTDSAD
ncbi:PAS domain-containing protein [Streptomyces sp. NPDC005931]|uniref:PAS domain-containing protein n=1 Tax=Streptomyces sp. NPDC005931 TaxID=3364737 RepID=UPI00368B370C